jgi:hypothetical protein
MNQKTFAFLLKYSSPFSILVVTETNKLVEINCPFSVRVVESVGNLRLSEIKIVTKVKIASNFKLVYIIDETPFYYHYFDILLEIKEL